MVEWIRKTIAWLTTPSYIPYSIEWIRAHAEQGEDESK